MITIGNAVASPLNELNEIDKVDPKPSLKFWAHNSPFVPRESDGRIIITDYSP